MEASSRNLSSRRNPTRPGGPANPGTPNPSATQSPQPDAGATLVRGEVTVRIRSDSDILNARNRGKLLAAETGFGSSDATVLSTMISGLARRMKPFHGKGSIVIQALQQGTRKGIAVSLAIHPERLDQPPADTTSGWTPPSLEHDDRLRSLAQRRVTDEFDLWPTGHLGTVVRAVKWL